jgi:SET domain-containing protein
MYSPLPDFLTINNSSIHGLGLFSSEDIPADTVLGITHVKDSRFEDGYIRTPLGGFYNHSDSPNCESIELSGLRYLRTICKVTAGEEITSSYNLYPIPQYK